MNMGLSSYPYLGGYADRTTCLDYYDRLDSASIPMLVIEDGPLHGESVATNPEMQRRYIARHAAILDQAGAIAWFQITFTDVDLADPGWPAGFNIGPFAHLGLVTTDLDPKPALSAWDATFDRPLR
jgi:hypothetical protein